MPIGVQTDMTTPALARFGSDARREQFLRPSITGDFVSCLCVSEDVAAITTTARKDGDDCIHHAFFFSADFSCTERFAVWTTNGTQADWMCLLANTSAGPAHANRSPISLPVT